MIFDANARTSDRQEMSGETRMQNRTRWDAQRTYLICGRHAVVYLATVIEQRSSTEEAKTAKQAFGATLTRLPVCTKYSH